ncbi:MAG: hypothetical protein M0036_11955 [Desulfobacteraceae bacterium]|nr:hypothetical protein [Desulfobacteraceae bacterium]
MEAAEHKESLLRTWIWIAVAVAIILLKGFLSFFVVSDMGQPTWNYRPMPDVPASSPYAVYPHLPYSQHIRGAKGE